MVKRWFGGRSELVTTAKGLVVNGIDRRDVEQSSKAVQCGVGD